MYFWLGISLTLAFLLIVNMLVAIFASAFWRIVSSRVRLSSVGMRAQIIFGLRVLPVAASLVFVFAFLVPSYLLHEPIASGEVVSGKLGLIALFSSLGVIIAIFRVVQTWRVTRRLATNWLNAAVKIELDDVDIPIHRIRHEFPVIAVIGIFHPRLFVAEQVLESLDPGELSAAISHEYGHLRANDNFKRTLLRVCRDLLILPFGIGLDNDWADNAESVADEYAASKSRSTALDLASALVKIARIAPAGKSPAMPAGAFLINEQNTDITSRVRRLIRLSEASAAVEHQVVFGFSPVVWVSTATLAVLVALPLLDGRFLASTHEAVEQFVSLLR